MITRMLKIVGMISYFMPFLVNRSFCSGSGMIWHLSLQSTILHCNSEEVGTDKLLIDSRIFVDFFMRF